ncbi:hypothetical protein FA15DRAFT_599269 [Coprinopsis marcescibilis]|uniref:DNA breaking-rejoining enzyme n=1 Tax=Coprinopsis marcescibilis TaxID=230819 RepID=A0A5C3KK24_COPMA|nr:hypothetical protein FA15DRAFT_599269 [Coprinopsis marcescibilis]
MTWSKIAHWTQAISTSAVPSAVSDDVPAAESLKRHPENPAPATNHTQTSKRPRLLAPSELRPVGTPNRDRLRVWVPLNARVNQRNDTAHALADLEKLTNDIQGAFAPSTREAYGTGLFAFHAFCDSKGVPEEQRTPASPTLIAMFASSMVGLYAGSTACNYVYAVRAWHIIHGIKWSVNTEELDALLKSAEKSVPATSKREKRDPFTTAYILKIRAALNLQDPLHVAVYACLTMTFYATARLGEFVLKSLDSFDTAKHVKPSDVRVEVDRQGLSTTIFHIPSTKMVPAAGEDVMWARQDDDTDPKRALADHMRVNNPPADGPLFAYKHRTRGRKGDHKPLAWRKFLEVIDAAAKAAGLVPLKGHGIRIGSTLEYLLRGVPFEVMKTKGRWGSDAFLQYLRQHAQILALYIQANSTQHEEFIQLVMPPIRR